MSPAEASIRLAELASEPDKGIRLSEAVAVLEARLIELGETAIVEAFRALDVEWA